MTRDEVYLQYKGTMAKIDKQAHEAREKARATLQEQLQALRSKAHEELRAIRAIAQKTKGGKL